MDIDVSEQEHALIRSGEFFYPGAEKLADVVNAFYGALSLDGSDDHDMDITKDFARALFAVVLHVDTPSAVAAIMQPQPRPGAKS